MSECRSNSFQLSCAPELTRVPLPPPLRLRKDILKPLTEERQAERG